MSKHFKFGVTLIFLSFLLPAFVFADTPITSSTTEWGAYYTDSKYILSSNVTISSRITVKGSVTLQLNSGCTLTASSGITVSNGNTLIIEGAGTLIANGPANYAGIGGNNTYPNNTAGEIIINGGTIVATGGTYGAGIGGGGIYNNNANFTKRVIINGGNITATGGSEAAGIGGGHLSSLDYCEINGGTVKATGGSHGASGIGGGDGSLWAGAYGGAGTIIINGGDIEAKSQGNGCGIGGGSTGGCGRLEINGGKVKAISMNGYALGSGPGGPPEVVKINWTTLDDCLEVSGRLGGIHYDKESTFIEKDFRYFDTGTDGMTVTKFTESDFSSNFKIVPLDYNSVSFMIGYTTYAESDPTKTFYGSRLQQPEAPDMSGYTFYGWYHDRLFTTEWNFAGQEVPDPENPSENITVYDTVQGDITLYAKMIPDEIKVTVPAIFEFLIGNPPNVSPKVTSLDGSIRLRENIDYEKVYKYKNILEMGACNLPGQYTVNITGIGDYDGKSCSAEFRVLQIPSTGSGTQDDPYVISTTTDWNRLSNNYENGNSFSGKYVILGADLEITKSLGSDENPFDAIFDCRNYAITIADSASNCDSIFTCIRGAEIKNLYTTLAPDSVIKKQKGRNSLENIQTVYTTPQSDFNKIITSAGGQTYYLPGTELLDLQEQYYLNVQTEQSVNINPSIKVAGQILTKGTDYTTSITDGTGNPVPAVTQAGDYTITFTGNDTTYTGSLSRSFNVKLVYVAGGSIFQDSTHTTCIKIPGDGTTFIFDASNKANFPKGTTFKIYDDGGQGGSFLAGAAGNFNPEAKGYLKITVAPEYQILFTGYVATKTKYDNLTLYDGDSATADLLYNAVHGQNNENDYILNLPTVNTSTNTALLYFNGTSWTCEGFELTATIVETRNLTANPDPCTSDVYYTTFYTQTENYIADDNTQVFYAQQNNDGKIILKEAPGRLVLKGQGVILKSNSAQIKLFTTNQTGAYTSLFTGTDTDIENAADAIDETVYIVGNNANGGVGFYKWAGSIPANKAFLKEADDE